MKFDNLKISEKLAIGFGIIIVIFVAYALFSFNYASRIGILSNEISSVRAPAVDASIQMINGVNDAITSLRGWVIFGEAANEAKWQHGWIEIREAEQKMKRLAEGSVSTETKAAIEKISKLLAGFEQYQQEIEDIAQRPENMPATNLLLVVAAPLAEVMSRHISQLIDIEATLPGTANRKSVLLAMANTRGSIGFALASLRAYLISGEQHFRDEFNRQWHENSDRYNELVQIKHLLNPRQLSIFTEFSEIRNKFSKLPPRMISIREKPDWNLAAYWIKTRANPKAAELHDLLDKLVSGQLNLLSQSRETVQSDTQKYVELLLSVSILILVVSIIIGAFISRSVSEPINRAVTIANNIANGDLETRIDELNKQDHSETSQLLESIRHMAEQLDGTMRKLSAAQESAEKLSEAKSLFLTSMSHEFRTPLNAIIGFSQLLEMDPDNPLSEGQLDSIKYILSGGEGMLALINQILMYIDLESNQREASIHDISPLKIVADVIENITPIANIHSALVVQKEDKLQPPNIITDDSFLKDILKIFLSNAIAYGGEGEKVEISCKKEDGFLRFLVKDHGPGIPEQEQEKLFHPFERLAQHEGTISGAGVGLPAAKLMADKIGGKIGYYSKEGEGSSFWIDLPLPGGSVSA